MDARDDEAGAVIWARTGTTHRGRAPSLTHEQITATATAIADAEGLEAVSMRRVARELGVGTMSLYRYVATRDEILELMSDAAMGEIVVDHDEDTWRETLTVSAHRYRGLILRHPWIVTTLGPRPTIGPNSLRWLEGTLAHLDRPGLTIDQILDMTGTVLAFVQGYTRDELAEREAQRTTGLSGEQWRRRQAPYMRTVLGDGRHPYLERVVRDAEDFPDPDAQFDRRLGYILDGLAAGLSLQPGT